MRHLPYRFRGDMRRFEANREWPKTTRKLAEYMGVGINTARERLQASGMYPRKGVGAWFSTSGFPVWSQDDAAKAIGGGFVRHDIRRARRESAEYDPERAAMISEAQDRILEVLDVLMFREREIVKLRYGIGDGFIYTLEEVAKIWKISKERARQIEMKAIRKLQHPDRARRLETLIGV